MSDLPVLLGEAPSRGGDRYHALPLSGPPARVLCTLAGIPPQADGSTYGRWTWALYDRFECRNLFDRYRQATPWSAPAARDAATRLLPELGASRVVVLLGRRVQDALGVPGEFHRWTPLLDEDETTRLGPGRQGLLRRLLVVAIPHPSGLNRSLNDAAERDRCGETLRRALDLAAA